MSSVNEQSDIARLVAASTTGESVGRLWTAGDLRSAIRGQNLDIAYQPVVSMRTGKIIALEALARWTTPSGSSVAPDVFIPMAEESGLIGELGAQILRKATRAAARWQSIAPTGLRVNISAREVEAPSFYDDVMRALAHADLDPRLLGLEMSEPSIFQAGTASATNLTRLRAAGITLLLDDFGAGYSSLGSEQTIPVIDVLKVDRSFLAGEGNERALASVVDLARARNVEVSAEGVENATQHNLVVDHGCDYAQGYFFARPIAGSLVPKMLGSWAPFLPARPVL
jgi:EAL domain-containing protein (putative c-di-GMP-specific phosphodiesterase class I)